MAAVEQCPHRDAVQVDADGQETARCGLLCDVMNCGTELASFRLPRAACVSCVDGIPPAVNRLNPVLASFVYSAGLEIVSLGGTPNCEPERARELQQWATSFVEVEVSGRRPTPTQPRSFRNCCYLGKERGVKHQPTAKGNVRTVVYQCEHLSHDLTTEAACQVCHDWAAAPCSTKARLADFLPAPEGWHGGTPPTWAVGMTTAPRRSPTLETSLDYLQRAGWSNVWLAVDGAATIPATIGPETVSLRSPTVGAWPNFYLTLQDLVLSQPEADAILMLQDDVLFYDQESVRDYLDSILWPTTPPGILSLYCPAAYTRTTPGWSICDQRWEWGALAFVFPAVLARRFLCDARVIQHRATDRGLRFIDDVVGEWAERNGIPIWYPTPSLVQHIGHTSTVWPGVPAEGFRRADVFAGDGASG